MAPRAAQITGKKPPFVGNFRGRPAMKVCLCPCGRRGLRRRYGGRFFGGFGLCRIDNRPHLRSQLRRANNTYRLKTRILCWAQPRAVERLSNSDLDPVASARRGYVVAIAHLAKRGIATGVSAEPPDNSSFGVAPASLRCAPSRQVGIARKRPSWLGPATADSSYPYRSQAPSGAVRDLAGRRLCLKLGRQRFAEGYSS